MLDIRDSTSPITTTARWRRLDRWTDALLPASLLTLLFDGTGEPHLMAAVIVIWLTIRLLNQATSQPYNWILLFLLITQLQPILSQSKYPASTPSDLLIPAIAFGCGYIQTRESWERNTLLILLILPVSLVALRHEVVSGIDILTLEHINRNRSGFLYGLLAVLGASLALKQPRQMAQWIGGASAALAYALALASGSRASAVIPPACIALGLITQSITQSKGKTSTQTPTWLKPAVIFVFGIVATGFVAWSWYAPTNGSSQRNIDSDRGRIDIARCYVENATADLKTTLVGMGQGKDKASRVCAPSTAYARQGKGLAHAHNSLVQLFAENGLISLVLICTVLARTGLACIQSLQSSQAQNLDLAALAIFIYIIAFSFADGTLIRFPVQQALQGYLLALPLALQRGASPCARPPN
jgi:O-antigen ligase